MFGGWLKFWTLVDCRSESGRIRNKCGRIKNIDGLELIGVLNFATEEFGFSLESNLEFLVVAFELV